MHPSQKYTKVLTIAGSDSGGGAGIQADLKTFAACGCYGMSAITAITAQNTQGVRAIHPVPVDVLEAQIRAVLDDIGAEAIKIGMLHSTEVITCVARLLREYRCKHVILDPVMVATSGDRLIELEAVEALVSELLPLVTLVTPNIPEAELLSGASLADHEDVVASAKKMAHQHGVSVLVKAGHLDTAELVDVLLEQPGQRMYTYSNKKITTSNSHGTGCTLSSAIASFVASGRVLNEAVGMAEAYLHGALRGGAHYAIGHGHGPVHHFWKLWR